MTKSEPGAGGQEKVYTNTRQEMASVREEANAVSLIPEDPAASLGVALERAALRPAAVARPAGPNARGSP